MVETNKNLVMECSIYIEFPPEDLQKMIKNGDYSIDLLVGDLVVSQRIKDVVGYGKITNVQVKYDSCSMLHYFVYHTSR